jgi:AAA15 family ATPase/GTPase
MFFNQIDIRNFRGIESLTINNLKQVNLITGRNNCGKTSILEAVFLLTGMSNPQLAVNINSFRDLLLIDDEDFSYLFNNFDLLKNISISGLLDSQERRLEIKAGYPKFPEISKQISEQREELIQEEFVSNVTTAAENNIEGLTFTFYIDNDKYFKSEIKLRQRKLVLSSDYKEKISANFLNPMSIMNHLDRRLDAILIRKDLDKIINALKEIEPNLLDIRMGARGMVYADVGMDKLVPINIMGDGIRRILAILAAISEKKHGILLIDEVENGLHYTTLSVLWKSVFKAASDNHVQLFITTHSYECVQAITQTFQESLDIKKDFLCLFRIEKNTEGQHRAFQYDADTLVAGIEKEFEVR